MAPYFFLFMVIWAYLRHYVNLKIIWSILTTFKTVGPFELNWDTQQYKCWISQYITFALLASLQAVNLFWWFFVCRIAYRFVVYKDADDDRSEYDPTDDEVNEHEALLNEEVNVQVKKTEKTDKVDKVEKAEKTEKTEKMEKMEKIDTTPATPASGAAVVDEDSIGSRVKQRKSAKQQ